MFKEEPLLLDKMKCLIKEVSLCHLKENLKRDVVFISQNSEFEYHFFVKYVIVI